MRGRVGLLAGRRTFHGVQDLVALVDAGAHFLLTREIDRIVEVTDDAAVAQVQLGCELEFDRQVCLA
jgi:hypothetical protein